MPLFQRPAKTPEEIAAGRPLDVSPDQVMTMDEREWYARVYRGDDVPQLTVRAVVMGCALGFVLAFTNLYIGLKTGWVLPVAITACILSYSIWNGLLAMRVARTPMSILENNCMQSCASCAGYGTGTTMVTAIPAMLMLSASDASPGGKNLPWWFIAAWTFVLAVLGVSLAIPMKRSMINRERLRFPEGTAAAVMLHSLLGEGQEALKKARALYSASAVAALMPILKDLRLRKVVGDDGVTTRAPLIPDSSPALDWLPKVHGADWSAWTVSLDHGLLLIGAGVIVGMRIAASMALGTLILVLFLGPHALDATWTDPAGKIVAAARSPGTAWKDVGIWYGAPLMVGYGLTTFALQGKMILRAFRGLGGAGGSTGDADDAVARGVEVPRSWFWVGAGASSIAAIVLARACFGIPIALGALAVVMSVFLTVVAARATGETSVTPSGPLGKIVQLTYGVLMPQDAVANLMTASISANASGSCADLLNDLKVGYLLGANPRRQFVAQLFGVVVGTVAVTIGYFILVPDASVLVGTPGHAPAFPAPGAQQWKAVADVFRLGFDHLHPMARAGIGWGLAAGVAFALVEAALPKLRPFLPSATGIGFGLLLPGSVPLSFLIGATLRLVFERVSPDRARRFAIPLASGAIAGESILGVIVAALNNFVL